MNIDIERFISEIEQRPEIWDMKCHEYSDRLEKVKKWEEIVNIFTDENVSVAEKGKQAQMLQKRWRTLRDAFVKERRQLANASGSAATNKKRYKYYNQLLFLLPVISTNRSEEEKDPLEGPHEDIITTPEPKKTKKSIELEKQKSEPTEKVDHELVNVLKSAIQQMTQEEDPDRQFMLSLVSDLKRVPPRLKPMVKMNMLKCIMEAQDEMYDSHQVHRPEHDQPHATVQPSFSNTNLKIEHE